MPQTAVTTNLVAGFAGMIADNTLLKDVNSYLNAEASAQFPFGIVVMQGTNDNDALLLTAGNVAKILGVVVYNAAYQKNVEVGTVADAGGRLGINPGVPIGVLRRGRIWVTVEEAVTPASAVRVRCTVAGNGTGTFRTTSAGAGLSMVMVGARYLDTAAISGITRLEFDILSRNQFTAD